MLELHCHTTCSDGSLSPSQLVEAAARAGVKALAISDHDTLAGWDEAVEAGSRWAVEIVPAVELSTVWQGRSLHLLGFYPRREQLTPPLEKRRQGRIRRAEAMVQRLTELGYPIPMPNTPIAPGRPHLAQALVRAGHVRNACEAFERFLGDDGPAFVPYEKFSALEGIQLLRSCGAVPVWAHPGLFRGDPLENTFAALLGAGLMGLEVYHPDHSVRQKRQLLKLAQKHNLVVTGGSDYHGPNPAGFHLNMMGLSLDLLDALKAAHAQVSA
ncbi:PHP domain-containing protein [Thermostichus vulcanus]|uniref:PHP domain-containing protein n=1 Tax=Thermostichus vulcanus str. 'Rupite' TaxID=2813851 RepID=A0ABT0CCJ6_THEVL|nr:PHP domain-containing protein [Thermostichus vulcanus]MCJ2543513.1 PHP domain-containing protein [Thermostichus vulcanus str. 'Rupite']